MNDPIVSVVLVDDGARIIRPADAARAVTRAGSIRMAAAVLGVDKTTLWRFLRRNDYAFKTVIGKTKAVSRGE